LGKRSGIRSALGRALSSDEKESYEVVVVDRLAPGGERVLKCSEIARITSAGTILLRDGAQIPLHRVIKVLYEGEPLFERKPRKL